MALWMAIGIAVSVLAIIAGYCFAGRM